MATFDPDDHEPKVYSGEQYRDDDEAADPDAIPYDLAEGEEDPSNAQQQANPPPAE